MEAGVAVAWIAAGGGVATGALALFGRRSEQKTARGTAAVQGLDVLNEALQQDNGILRDLLSHAQAALVKEVERRQIVEEALRKWEDSAGAPYRRATDRKQ